MLRLNAEHARHAIKTRRTDSHHSLALLEGVLCERDEGKISGHFHAPSNWHVDMAPPTSTSCNRDRATPLLPFIIQRLLCRLPFTIVTENNDGTPKVRRGEDWQPTSSRDNTDFGPTPWMNHVLLFGATWSVWAYGTVSDHSDASWTDACVGRLTASTAPNLRTRHGRHSLASAS